MAAVLRRMREPPGALDGTGSSKRAGGEKERSNAEQNILMAKLKMKQHFLLYV
jgi:hypothetical protein